jgi:hypothetical protein
MYRYMRRESDVCKLQYVQINTSWCLSHTHPLRHLHLKIVEFKIH